MRTVANTAATAAIALLAVAYLTANDVLSAISTLTPSGILIWYLWYTQTKTFPEMVRDHKSELIQAQVAFTETLAAERTTRIAELREAFASTLKAERTTRIEELRAISQCRFPGGQNVSPHDPQGKTTAGA